MLESFQEVIRYIAGKVREKDYKVEVEEHEGALLLRLTVPGCDSRRRTSVSLTIDENRFCDVDIWHHRMGKRDIHVGATPGLWGR